MPWVVLWQKQRDTGRKLVNGIHLRLQWKKNIFIWCLGGFMQMVRTVSMSWGYSLPSNDDCGVLPPAGRWNNFIPSLCCAAAPLFALHQTLVRSDIRAVKPWLQKGPPWLQQHRVGCSWALGFAGICKKPLSSEPCYWLRGFIWILSVSFCAWCILITQMIKQSFYDVLIWQLKALF